MLKAKCDRDKSGQLNFNFLKFSKPLTAVCGGMRRSRRTKFASQLAWTSNKVSNAEYVRGRTNHVVTNKELHVLLKKIIIFAALLARQDMLALVARCQQREP